MKAQSLRLLPLFILMSMALQGCKKPLAFLISPASARTAPEPQAANKASRVATNELSFDFTTIAEASAPIPPFPYIDYPPRLPVGSRATVAYPMDEVDVMLGRQLHRLEGSISMRTFAHRDAAMSAAEVRAHYQQALRSFGAVKVNVDEPDAHYSADPRMAALRAPYYEMSYDVYLARKGAARHWIVLMHGENATRLLSIEERPFTQTIGYEGRFGAAQAVTVSGAPAAAPQPLDIDALPVHSAPLPHFPYLPFPDKVPVEHRKAAHASVDTASFIVGAQLRSVVGRVETRLFDNRFAGMSPMAIRRNYEAAMKGLGAVQLNTVAPEDTALIAANGRNHDMRSKLRIDGFGMSYASYLVRTPHKNIWLALMFSNDRTNIVVVEEQAARSGVAPLSSDAMLAMLASNGHVP